MQQILVASNMDYFEILIYLRNSYNLGDFLEQLNDCHNLKRTGKGYKHLRILHF